MSRVRARDGWEWSVRITGYHGKGFRRWRGLRGMRSPAGTPIVSNPLDAMREGTWTTSFKRPSPAEVAAIAGEASLADGFDGDDLISGCAVGLAGFLAVAVVVGFIVPAASVTIELILLAVLGLFGYAMTLLGRRPWLVTATSLDRLHTYRATSWRAARALKAEVISALRTKGRPPDLASEI